jgi:hypothetical protein
MATGRPRPKPRIFTYEQALETFPAVRDLTAAAVRQVEAAVNRVESQEELEARKDEIEAACERVVQAWSLEIQRLGCEVKGLWLVDWDCGDGYYCWKYPEEAVCHFHGYEEGFAGRVAIV